MTEAPSWRAYVAAMVEKAQARQDEEFYRLALPGWQAELKRIMEETNGDHHSDLRPVVESGQP